MARAARGRSASSSGDAGAGAGGSSGGGSSSSSGGTAARQAAAAAVAALAGRRRSAAAPAPAIEPAEADGKKGGKGRRRDAEGPEAASEAKRAKADEKGGKEGAKKKKKNKGDEKKAKAKEKEKESSGAAKQKKPRAKEGKDSKKKAEADEGKSAKRKAKKELPRDHGAPGRPAEEEDEVEQMATAEGALAWAVREAEKQGAAENGASAASAGAAAEEGAGEAGAQKVSDERELRAEIARLKEVLGEKESEAAAERDPATREDLSKDAEMLKDWLREKEVEMLKVQAKNREKALNNDISSLKEILKEKKGEDAPQDKEESAPQETKDTDNDGVAHEEQDAAGEGGDEIETHTMPPPSKRAVPSDLPVWCVIPNAEDIALEVAIVRVTHDGKPTRLLLGRRSWALFGRRDTTVKGPQPDVGLSATRASRTHALLLRNWRGQVYLMDLGSTHGTFLGKQRLEPRKEAEWKVGAKVYFADPRAEVFQLVPYNTKLSLRALAKGAS